MDSSSHDHLREKEAAALGRKRRAGDAAVVKERLRASPANRKVSKAGAERVWRRNTPVTDIAKLIRTLGGPKRVGDRLGISHSTVCCWQRRGLIPSNQAEQILLLFPEASEKEVMALAAEKRHAKRF